MKYDSKRYLRTDGSYTLGPTLPNTKIKVSDELELILTKEQININSSPYDDSVC